MRTLSNSHLVFSFLVAATALGCAAQTPAAQTAREGSAEAQARPAEAAADAFRASRPPPIAPGHFEFPTPHVVRLENGLNVYWVPRKTRVLTLAFVVRHGASSVPEGKSGLAALTARMLTEGTSWWS